MSIKTTNLVIFISFFLFYQSLGKTSRHTHVIQPPPTFLIMLNPAGDARFTGRKIDETFEYGITMQYVERLKKELELRYINSKILITRSPGECIAPLQNANFANRAHVHLFISIHFYQETEPKPCIYLYTFNNSDSLITKTIDLSFYPYDKAYLFNYTTTQAWATILRESLSQESYARLFDVKGMYSIPFKPLIGIKAPAIAFEIGLHHKHDWQNFIQPITESIGSILQLEDARV